MTATPKLDKAAYGGSPGMTCYALRKSPNHQTTMNQDTLQQIAQVDEKLTILRESWMDSKPEKKSTWMAKIDGALDERSKLMKIRDGIPPLPNADVLAPAGDKTQPKKKDV